MIKYSLEGVIASIWLTDAKGEDHKLFEQERGFHQKK